MAGKYYRKQSSDAISMNSYAPSSDANSIVNFTFTWEDQREGFKQRKLEQITQMITVPQSSHCDNYELYPVKPGFFFWKSLIIAKQPISKLKLNIPNMLYYCGKIYHLKTNSKGFIEWKIGAGIVAYMDEMLGKQPPKDSENVLDHVGGIFKYWTRSDMQGMQQQILNWEDFSSRLLKWHLDHCQLMQQYIKPIGGQPATTRLYYFHGNRLKANYAVLIQSKQPVGNRTDLLTYTVVKTDRPEILDVFKLSGKALEPYEEEAQKIVQHLSLGHHIRIDYIILDFVRDESGKVWLIGCKDIKLDTDSMPENPDILSFEQYMKINVPPQNWKLFQRQIVTHNTQNIKQAYKNYKRTIITQKHDNLGMNVRCKLCHLSFTQSQLCHSLPMNLLMLCKHHVAKRYVCSFDLSHIKVTSIEGASSSARLCQQCFVLVTTEYDLIKTEQEMAKYLHIDLGTKNLEELQRVYDHVFVPHQKLLQWRLMLFFESFDTTSFMKFHEKWQLKLKYGPRVFTIDLNPMSRDIKVLKVYHIFSALNKSWKSYFDSTSVEISIVKIHQRSGRTAVKYKGEDTMFDSMPGTLPIGHSLRETKNLTMLGTQQFSKLSLRIVIGISCDQAIDKQFINSNLSNDQGLYIPEEDFISSNPLPDAWFELFEEYQGVKEPDTQLSYAPHMSEEDFRHMKPFSTKHRKLKLLAQKTAPSTSRYMITPQRPDKEQEQLQSPRRKCVSTIPSQVYPVSPRNGSALDPEVEEVMTLIDGYFTGRTMTEKMINTRENLQKTGSKTPNPERRRRSKSRSGSRRRATQGSLSARVQSREAKQKEQELKRLYVLDDLVTNHENQVRKTKRIANRRGSAPIPPRKH